MKRFFLFRRLFFALAFFFIVILAIEVVCGDWFGEPTYNINNLNVSSDPSGGSNGKDDFDTPMEHMSKESREEMR